MGSRINSNATKMRHDVRCRERPTGELRFAIRCSCGWWEDVPTESGADRVMLNHRARPDLDTVSAYVLCEEATTPVAAFGTTWRVPTGFATTYAITARLHDSHIRAGHPALVIREVRAALRLIGYSATAHQVQGWAAY